LSPRARAVAGEALALARAVRGELVFLHVGEDTPKTRGPLEEILREMKQREFAGADALEGKVTLRIVAGRPDEVVRRVALEHGANLIVAGALEKEGMIEGLFGSVARRIVRKAPCSVLLLTEPFPTQSRFHRMVISAEMTAGCSSMIRFAVGLARDLKTQSLHMVYEPNYFENLASRYEQKTPLPVLDDNPSCAVGTLIRMQSYLEEFDFAGFEVVTRILDGAEGLESAEYARGTDADLLVFPAPARPLGFWDRFFHHPTEHVLEKLPCSVLIYRKTEGRGK
jgi:nucleotide-binding universal stress UspA family protein